jgi:hypothetical protein
MELAGIARGLTFAILQTGMDRNRKCLLSLLNTHLSTKTTLSILPIAIHIRTPT